MTRTALERIGDLDFSFENSQVRVIANRNSPEIKLAGFDVGPFEEGSEYETYFWVALELDASGMAHLREDVKLNVAQLNKIQWTERVQAAGQISKLPESFYPKLRRCLAELQREASKAPEKLLEHEKTIRLTQDVVNARLKKIVSMASAPAQTEQALRNLTEEERFLYKRLYTLIKEWRTQILEFEGIEE